MFLFECISLSLMIEIPWGSQASSHVFGVCQTNLLKTKINITGPDRQNLPPNIHICPAPLALKLGKLHADGDPLCF